MIVDVHRLPLVPGPDLSRVFGRRDGPVRVDPDATRLRTAAAALDLLLDEPRLLRLALTDPGWCNEAETPPWVDPWPGNRRLADLGAPHLAGVDGAAVGEALDLWPHLWLAVGQRGLRGEGRATVLARAVAAVVGALVADAAPRDPTPRIATFLHSAGVRGSEPTAGVG